MELCLERHGMDGNWKNLISDSVGNIYHKCFCVSVIRIRVQNKVSDSLTRVIVKYDAPYTALGLRMRQTPRSRRLCLLEPHNSILTYNK